MKVWVASCGTGLDAWDHQARILKNLHAASDNPVHEWADSPEEAEIIFITDTLQNGRDVLPFQPLIYRFSEKSFNLSEQWKGPFLIAGIYANAPKELFWRGRFRSGCYNLLHPDFKNTFIENFSPEKSLPPEARDLLISFVGRRCHPCRDLIFDTKFSRPDIHVRDSSAFDAFSHGSSKEPEHREYFELCLRSKFMLCPRGAGPNSIRLFEALKMGIAPIIVSDAWIPSEGPDWRKFALFIRERDIPRIEGIVTHHEAEFIERGRLAREAWETFFSPQAYFNFLVSAAQSIQRSRVVPEKLFVALAPARYKLGQGMKRLRKNLALWSQKKRASS